MTGPVHQIDEAVDAQFERVRGKPVPDAVFAAASEAADFSVAWHAISIAIAVVRPGHRPHAVRLAVMLGIESLVVNQGIKRIFRRERPPLSEERAYEVRRPKTASFPSGHASSATLAALLLSESIPRARPIWAILGSIVALSRVHNRMHHASDVAAGVVVGVVFARMAQRFWPLGRGRL
ncbi:MAG: phosphatase PAP2 family protein [Actinomycetota bacterium]